MQSEHTRKKVPGRFLPASPGDAIRVSVRDGQSYAEILKEMKVNTMDAGLEVLTIRRTEEILLVLKKGGDVSAFERSLTRRSGRKPTLELWSQRDP